VKSPLNPFADPYLVAGALAKQGKDAVPALIEALGHTAPVARFQAARALSVMGKDATVAIPALEKCLNDADLAVQFTAAIAILRTGMRNGAALAKAATGLETDTEMLHYSLATLRDLGTAAQPLFPAVKKLALATPKAETRQACFFVLHRIGPQSNDLYSM